MKIRDFTSAPSLDAAAPGPTETSMLSQSGLPEDVIESVKQAEKAQIPLSRRGEPEEVAAWIVTVWRAKPEY